MYSPLSVVAGPSKKRLVVNLRHLNQFLWKQSFKCKDIRTALILFEKGDKAFTFDLKSVYHYVGIHKSCWKYLGFIWSVNIVQTYFAFKVLPLACPQHATFLLNFSGLWLSIGGDIVVYILSR